jgi:hypothetical protein
MDELITQPASIASKWRGWFSRDAGGGGGAQAKGSTAAEAVQTEEVARRWKRRGGGRAMRRASWRDASNGTSLLSKEESWTSSSRSRRVLPASSVNGSSRDAGGGGGARAKCVQVRKGMRQQEVEEECAGCEASRGTTGVFCSQCPRHLCAHCGVGGAGVLAEIIHEDAHRPRLPS